MIPLKDNWRLPFSFIELWRNLNRAARWLNGMQCEGGTVIHNDNGIRIVPDSSGINRPWHGTQIDATTISFQTGRWLRNPDLGNSPILLTGDAYESKTLGANDYVCAVLSRADLNFNPRIYPTVVSLVAVSTLTEAAIITALGGSLYYGGHVVLGKNTASVWAQYWHGGDITDHYELYDSDSEVTPVYEPATKTIERSPATMDERKSEVQLVGAGKSTWDNYNVPYLPKSSSGAGTLAWATIDSHAGTPAGKSLQVTSPGGVLQFYGWKGAAGGGQVVGDLVVINRAVAGVETAVYIDAESLSVGSALYATSSGTVSSIADHQHDELAGLSDDDHPQYVILAGNGRETNTGDVDVTGNVNVNSGVYKHASAAGISETREWDDANGKHHTVTVSGGIITGWTVA